MNSVPRIPMIGLPLRRSNVVPDLLPLRKCLETQYQVHPHLYEKEFSEILTARKSACDPSIDYTGLAKLKRYYSQLQLMRGRFKFSPETNTEIVWLWEEPLSGVVCEEAELATEEASIMYNIAALHSILGSKEKRSDADSMKVACTHFQCASWAFHALVERHLPLRSSVDLSTDLMTAMENIMTAQAQECIIEKSLMDDRPVNVTAKLAQYITDLYSQVVAELSSSDIADRIPAKTLKGWQRRCQTKCGFYAAMTAFLVGMNSEESRNFGIAVAWFQLAAQRIEEAEKSSKEIKDSNTSLSSFTGSIRTNCQSLAAMIQKKVTQATKDNDLIYHETVPSADSLEHVKGVCLVKGVPFDHNDPDIRGPDIFQRLVPMKTLEASSVYSELKASLLRPLITEVETKEEEMNRFLKTLYLVPDAILTPDPPLPHKLFDIFARIQTSEDDPEKILAKHMQNLADVSIDIDNQLKALDENIKALNLCTTSIPVSKLNDKLKHLRSQAQDVVKRYQSLSDASIQARQSNVQLRTAIDELLEPLKKLSRCVDDFIKDLPTVAKMIVDPEKVRITTDCKRLFAKIDEMRNQRRDLMSNLRTTLHDDDVTGDLLTSDSEKSESDLMDFFNARLKKHDPLITLLKQNLAAQDNITSALIDLNAEYTPHWEELTTARNDRTNQINQLINDVETYEAILNKCDQGIRFYEELKGQAKDVAADVDRIMESLQLELHAPVSASLSISESMTRDFQPPPLSSTSPLQIRTLGEYMKSMKIAPNNPSLVGPQMQSKASDPTFSQQISISSAEIPSNMSFALSNPKGPQPQSGLASLYRPPPPHMAGFHPIPGVPHQPNFQAVPNPTAVPSPVPPSGPTPASVHVPNPTSVPVPVPTPAPMPTPPHIRNPVPVPTPAPASHSTPTPTSIHFQQIPSQQVPNLAPMQRPPYTSGAYGNNLYINQPPPMAHNPNVSAVSSNMTNLTNLPSSTCELTLGSVLMGMSRPTGSTASNLNYPPPHQPNVAPRFDSPTPMAYSQGGAQVHQPQQQIWVQPNTTPLFTHPSGPPAAGLTQPAPGTTFPHANHNYPPNQVPRPPTTQFANQPYSVPPGPHQVPTSVEHFQPANAAQQPNFQQVQSGPNHPVTPQQLNTHNHMNYGPIPTSTSYSQMPATFTSEPSKQTYQPYASQALPNVNYPIQTPPSYAHPTMSHQPGTYHAPTVSSTGVPYSGYGSSVSSSQPAFSTHSAMPLESGARSQQVIKPNTTNSNYAESAVAQANTTVLETTNHSTPSTELIPVKSKELLTPALVPHILTQAELDAQKREERLRVAYSNSCSLSPSSNQSDSVTRMDYSNFESDLSSSAAAAVHKALTPNLSKPNKDSNFFKNSTSDIEPPAESVDNPKLPRPEPLADPLVLNRFIAAAENLLTWLDNPNELVELSDSNKSTKATSVSRLDKAWQKVLTIGTDFANSPYSKGKKPTQAVARCCPTKNRSQEFVPYDMNRVVLTSLKNDYINASHIDFLSNLGDWCPRYIICQAALPKTVVDFWTMILEQGCELVVLLLPCRTNNRASSPFATLSRNSASAGEGGFGDEQDPLHIPPHLPSNRIGSRLAFSGSSLELRLQAFKESSVSSSDKNLPNSSSQSAWVERILTLQNTQTQLTRSLVHLTYQGSFPLTLPVGVCPTMDPSVESLSAFISVVHSYYKQQRNLARPVAVVCEYGSGLSGIFVTASATILHSEMLGRMGDVFSTAGYLMQQRRGVLNHASHLYAAARLVGHAAIETAARRDVVIGPRRRHSTTKAPCMNEPSSEASMVSKPVLNRMGDDPVDDIFSKDKLPLGDLLSVVDKWHVGKLSSDAYTNGKESSTELDSSILQPSELPSRPLDQTVPNNGGDLKTDPEPNSEKSVKSNSSDSSVPDHLIDLSNLSKHEPRPKKCSREDFQDPSRLRSRQSDATNDPFQDLDPLCSLVSPNMISQP